MSNWDLNRVVILDTVLELDKVTYAHGWMCMCVEFRDEIPFKEGRMYDPRNSNFWNKGKNVILITKL